MAKSSLSASELLRRYRTSDRDFRHLHLAAVDLHGADLRHADFSHANLQGANLGAADLTGALFVGTNLRNVNFEGAVLAGADFTAADLQGVRGGSSFLATAISGPPMGIQPALELPTAAGSLTAVNPQQPPSRASVAPIDPQQPTARLSSIPSSLPNSSRGPELESARQEIHRLAGQLQSLRLWQGVTVAVALGFLFVTVLGGYLGYAQYRDRRDLQENLTDRVQERDERIATTATELEALRQEKQSLDAQLQAADERIRESEIQIAALQEQLEAALAQLATERERVEQLAETNQVLAETNQVIEERLKRQQDGRRRP